MSTTEAPTAPGDQVEDVDEEAKGRKGKRSNLLPAVIVAVGLVVGGFLMKPSSTAAAADEPVEEEVVPGELVTLELMTLNLSDGHYLRLGVAIELIEGVPAAEFEESGETNRYKDLIIDRVADLPSAQFATPEGRDDLKKLLRDGGHELFEDEFIEVYLTELVVQ